MKTRPNKQKHSFKTTVLIICDGETEKNYFDSMKTHRFSAKHIKISPELPKHSSFSNVIKDLLTEFNKKNEPSYTYVFYVLDMDTIHLENKYSEYCLKRDNLLKKKGTTNRLFFIESRPCIEFWFLLHYRSIDRHFIDCTSVTKDLQHYIPGYEKTNDFTKTVYNITNKNLDLAISNSKNVLSKTRVEAEQYSYSLIHDLIERIDSL